jgi:hypothetical protein
VCVAGVLLGCSQSREDLNHPGEEDLTRTCKGDIARRTGEVGYSEFTLESFDRLAQRRLSGVEPGGCATKVKLLRHSKEHT